MKNIILALAVIVSVFAYGQRDITPIDTTRAVYPHEPGTPVDTLKYLKTFEQNAWYYHGKTFSKLMQDMTLVKPTFVGLVPEGYYEKKKESKETFFEFVKKNPFNIGNIMMYVVWETPIPIVDENSPYIKVFDKNRGVFTQEMKDFFSGMIIKGIRVRQTILPHKESQLPPGASADPNVVGGDDGNITTVPIPKR